MKSIFALLVAGALATSVGCSGGMPSSPTPSSVGPQAVDLFGANSFGETLKANSIAVKQKSCMEGVSGAAIFSAKGKARGPHHGKFSVSGQWNFYKVGGQTLWTFAETFKIKGKHPIVGTITGNGTHLIATCKTFGPVTGLKDLTYHLGNASGPATTNRLQNGGSLLQRLH